MPHILTYFYTENREANYYLAATVSSGGNGPLTPVTAPLHTTGKAAGSKHILKMRHYDRLRKAEVGYTLIYDANTRKRTFRVPLSKCNHQSIEFNDAPQSCEKMHTRMVT